MMTVVAEVRLPKAKGRPRADVPQLTPGPLPRCEALKDTKGPKGPKEGGVITSDYAPWKHPVSPWRKTKMSSCRGAAAVDL